MKPNGKNLKLKDMLTCSLQLFQKNLNITFKNLRKKISFLNIEIIKNKKKKGQYLIIDKYNI